MKKKVSFDARKKEKIETDVSFTRKDGTEVEFPAHKTEKVPVHVQFVAKVKDKKR
jgi:hypothetical protein